MDNADLQFNFETEWRPERMRMRLKMKAKKHEEKKKVMLCGMLLCPVTVGKPAVFAAEGNFYRTSSVVALHEQTEDNIHFETKNTHYYLSMSPFPLAAMSPLPVRLATCA